MINPTMTATMNKQITAEFYAAYLYLSASSFLQKEGYPGMARWIRAQYEEELTHALRIVDFMYDRDGVVELGALKQPPSGFGSPLGVYEAALEHEKLVTKMIDDLYMTLRDGFKYYSVLLHDEFMSFVEMRSQTGHILLGAQSGCMDNRVMALTMAVQGLLSYYRSISETPERVVPYNSPMGIRNRLKRKNRKIPDLVDSYFEERHGIR